LRQRDALDAKGKKTSYRVIAKKYGVSHATIHRIIVYGTEPKDRIIRHRLGLGDYAVVPTCQKCGAAHVSKRCTRRSTFEDNAAAYDAWLASPETRRKLAAMLEWAETPVEQRSK
jgi:hypothetical protein